MTNFPIGIETDNERSNDLNGEQSNGSNDEQISNGMMFSNLMEIWNNLNVFCFDRKFE